jgi:GT2 family glycosyltransferase
MTLSSSQFAPNDSKSPAVLVVVLNWNTPDETLSAVDSVLRMDYSNVRVVVIDNGSSDNSLSVLADIAGERVELIASPTNLGFTGGCNLGFERALQMGADYVWLLNSDAVTEPGTLSSLVRLAENDPRIGLVSPVIASLEDPTRLLNAGAIYRPEVPAYEPTRSIELARKWAAEHPERMMLLGPALLVRTSLIPKIGPLDPDLFAYWEDTDYSLRSANAGFLNVVDFDSVIYHSEKMPRTEAKSLRPHYWYYLARNEIRFWKKHRSFGGRFKPLWWAFNAQMRIFNRLSGNETSRAALLAGLWHGWSNKTGPFEPSARMPSPIADIVTSLSRRFPDSTT